DYYCCSYAGKYSLFF
nr:immunoglobulin light chain junction region [Macaca mulatta]MOW02874.1 immunoglobulin light chain junction region [Macaca mulatta]